MSDQPKIEPLAVVERKRYEKRIATLKARVKELEDSLNAKYHIARIWREKAEELEGELAAHQEATKFTSRMHAAVLETLKQALKPLAQAHFRREVLIGITVDDVHRAKEIY